MYICEAQKVVYLAQPRTSTRSTVRWFYDNDGLRKIDNHHGINYAALAQYHREMYRSVCVVRNHWDYIISWFEAGLRRPAEPDFEKFCLAFPWSNGYHCPSQKRLFWRFPPVATHVLRYESMWDGWAEVMDTTGWSAPPHFGKSKDRKPYQEYYTPKLRDYVYDLYGEEIEYYGYKFD